MTKLTIEAPWYTYQKKLKALFESDTAIVIGDVQEDLHGYELTITVSDRAKYQALTRVLPHRKIFGNVVLTLTLIDAVGASTSVDEAIELYKTLFSGNRIVKDVKVVADAAGVHYGFIRFQPEVIQFFDDNMADLDGNWSGLAQDIADEVFECHTTGVHFCTADLRENK